MTYREIITITSQVKTQCVIDLSTIQRNTDTDFSNICSFMKLDSRSNQKASQMKQLTSLYRPLNIRLVGVFCLELRRPDFSFLGLKVKELTTQFSHLSTNVLLIYSHSRVYLTFFPDFIKSLQLET